MKVTFWRLAEDQFRDIQASFREINSNLAEKFAAEVRDAVWRLEHFPQSGQKVSRVRRVVLRRARYLMLYEITEEQKQALHLMNDEFCDLLLNVEAELPPEIDPEWRSGIRVRIQAVPAEFERRYREQEEYDGCSQAGQPQPTDRA